MDFKNYLAEVVDMSELNRAHESAKANCKAAEQQRMNAQSLSSGNAEGRQQFYWAMHQSTGHATDETQPRCDRCLQPISEAYVSQSLTEAEVNIQRLLVQVQS